MKHQELWDRYWATRSVQDRNALVEAHLPPLRKMVAKMHGSCPPNIRYGDLLQSAIPAMIDRIEKYNPNICQFITFCYRKVWAAMQDELRRHDLLGYNASRSYRRMGRKRPDMINLDLPFKFEFDKHGPVTLGETLSAPAEKDNHGSDFWSHVRTVLTPHQFNIVHGKCHGKDMSEMGKNKHAVEQVYYYSVRKMRDSGKFNEYREAA